jgi:TRAP-type transport system small permease protein
MLNKTNIAIKYTEKTLNFVALIMLFVIMILGTVNVIGRYVFNRPIIGSLEVSQIMMAGSFLLALAYTQAQRKHVTISDIVSRYPARLRTVVELVVLLISLALFGFMTWKSAALVGAQWQQNVLIQTLRIPEAPFRVLVPLGAFVLCLEIISQCLHLISQMKRGN